MSKEEAQTIILESLSQFINSSTLSPIHGDLTCESSSLQVNLAGNKLRRELKKLLGSKDFQNIGDLDQMTDILMNKLQEIAISDGQEPPND